jgi:RHS repeat-associated protein
VYNINDLNQITSHSEYDQNGNPKQFADLAFRYDALDRLIEIQAPAFTQSFTYDSLNRCLTKTTTDRKPQETLYFLYDGLNEIGSFNQNLQLQDLRILGRTSHAEIGAAVALLLQGQVYLPVHDLQGNVAALLPLAGGDPVTYRYSAFGEETSTNATPNPWRFSSKRTDASTGLVNFGRRYYLPALGRWLTPDPETYTDGVNLYAFVHNNPLTHLDLYGLRDLCDWVSGDPDYHQQVGLSEYDFPFNSQSRSSYNEEYYAGRELNAMQPYASMPTQELLAYVQGMQRVGSPLFLIDPEIFCQVSSSYLYPPPHLDAGAIVSSYLVEDILGVCGLFKAGISLGRAVSSSGFVKNAVNRMAKTATQQQGSRSGFHGRGTTKVWPAASEGRQLIRGLEYTTHALERMSPRGLIQKGTEIVSRGVPPSVIENAIKFGTKTAGSTPNEIIHIFENVRVVTNLEATRVITVITTGR